MQNLDLKPERISSYEANITAMLAGDTTLGLTLFKSELKDMIQTAEVETPTGMLYQYQNTGKAKAEGVTLTYDGAWGPWKASLGATWQDGESVLEGETIPTDGVPDRILNGLLSFRSGAFTAALTGVWRSAVDSPVGHPDPRGRRLSSDEVLNLNLAYDFAYVLPMRVQVKVLNLFDADFNQPTSLGIVPSRLPSQGRTVLLDYQVRF